MDLNKQEGKNIGLNFPGVDLGIKNTKQVFQEGAKKPDNIIIYRYRV